MSSTKRHVKFEYLSAPGADPEFVLGRGADPEAIYKSWLILKIML